MPTASKMEVTGFVATKSQFISSLQVSPNVHTRCAGDGTMVCCMSFATYVNCVLHCVQVSLSEAGNSGQFYSVGLDSSGFFYFSPITFKDNVREDTA